MGEGKDVQAKKLLDMEKEILKNTYVQCSQLKYFALMIFQWLCSASLTYSR